MHQMNPTLSPIVHNLLSALDSLSEKSVNWLLLLSSMALACWLIYIQHGWINDDSVLYFEVARLFSIGKWQEGLALYNWPLYPALIALIHRLGNFGIQCSAQILNVALFAVTTLSFGALVRLSGGNNLTVFCAALLLYGSPYIVGDVLPMLLRDQGFWAFFLTSLVFFVRFYRDGKIANALLWQIAAIVAMLFRLEAISYLLLTPLIFLVNTRLAKRERLMRILQAYTLSLLAVGALTATLIAVPSFSLTDLGRLQEIVALFESNYLQITQNIADKAQLMGELLGDHLDDFGMLGILLTLAIIIPIKTIEAASWWTVGLLALRPKGNVTATADTQRILLWVAIIALLNACLIIMSTFVLTSRYVIALGFILMLLAAFNMAALFDRDEQRRARKRIGMALLIILSLSLIKNIWPKDASYYNYEQDAVAWVKENTPPDSDIFYASSRSRFYAGTAYAGRADPWQATIDAISNGSIHDYDYLVLDMEAKHPERKKEIQRQLIGYKPIKEFPGFRNKKQIMIFSRQ